VERQFVLRGLGAGALAGLFCFVFARLFIEPVIQQAIDYESGRDAMENTLRKAAGLAPNPPSPELFSRSVQDSIGVGTGLVLFGIAMGGLFAVTYFVAYGRIGEQLSPRVLAVLVAAAGFLGLYLLPFLKYPANPPAIGHPETIEVRTALYLAMVAVSLVALTLGASVFRKLGPRLGGWNAGLVGVGVVAAAVGIAMALLPPLGHLHANVAAYGRYATETPQPLRDATGVIVYPGFPADTLFKFRLYSILNQLILWGTIGFVFGALIERVLEREAGRSAATSSVASDADSRSGELAAPVEAAEA
jgi:hypothetical protein